AWNTATYVANDPQFGWIAFGGNLRHEGGLIRVTPLDSARKRVYIAPYGLGLALDAGNFDSLELDEKTRAVLLRFSASTPFTQEARLRIEQPAKIADAGKYQPTRALKRERDAYVIPLNGSTSVELTAQK